ncbi:hypothetical protein HDF12_001565 [Edaphobacter lichenicola]|uniref:Uncharacterized protein n=1 Tax=Tunturiibacter lichenicola TaxID=2051959 RepID=A0A7Y9NLV4_9BACT|nr:hypothetical protein [Edaphobacter lichenicola]
MKRSWETESGHLACSWSEEGQQVWYDLRWMQETSSIQGGYLLPVPDFASKSPFGGGSWFQPRTAYGDSE